VSAKARILVVDDERSMQEFLEILLRREGYDVTCAGDVDGALVALDADDFDVVISDLQMPGKTGLDLLHALRDASPDTVAIVMTAYASTETAIAAMKEGAYDYLTKPFQVDEIRLVLEKALEKKLLARENRRLRHELRSQTRQRALIGNGPAIQRVYELVAQVAETRANVLITGESGTGKELVARAIHASSERRDRAFVAVNCGAIPENLLESELFGHVKGAFTGAVSNKEGLFETADGGTLFLDEIGELPGALQVKLLRVLQEKTIRRVGGNGDRRIDVRILAATNKRLEDEVGANRFREDLYYRLNVIQIGLPPLRERREDVPLLVQHFIDRYARELGKPIEGASDAAMARLVEHSWPGNVRELENVIERAVALSRGDRIELEALPPNLLRAPGEPAARTSSLPVEGANLEHLVNDYERGLLLEALQRAGGVKKRAAKLLGVSFRSFRYRLQKLGLDEPSPDED
jgi:two-component system response regulator PilR (NtrC family)